MRKTIVLALAALAGAVCGPSVAAQQVVGTYSGWKVLRDGKDGCVMVHPAAYENAPRYVYLRIEEGEDLELTLSEVVQQRVANPAAVDWGRLDRAQIWYAFDGDLDEEGEKIEGWVGKAYLNPQQVRREIALDVDEAFVADMARAAQLFVAVGSGDASSFAVAGAARALAETRKCAL